MIATGNTNMNKHKQVAFNGHWVDEGMRELLDQMFEKNIFTSNSCQEKKPGIAWIEFPRAYELFCFLALVSPYKDPKNGLYQRITRAWEYTVNGSTSYSIPRL